ncbi:MAG: hypothetical protein QY307_05715 [Acidimicrobiia bacterium]|nr:MAG: hypothetical protein QY307_05715 [Acidimicrobiia bacterium]
MSRSGSTITRRRESKTMKKILLLLIVVAVGLLIAKQFTSHEH